MPRGAVANVVKHTAQLQMDFAYSSLEILKKKKHVAIVLRRCLSLPPFTLSVLIGGVDSTLVTTLAGEGQITSHFNRTTVMLKPPSKSV